MSKPELRKGDYITITGSTGKTYHGVFVGESGKHARVRRWQLSKKRFGSIQNAAWGDIAYYAGDVVNGKSAKSSKSDET